MPSPTGHGAGGSLRTGPHPSGPRRRPDVLVVGAGLAGLACAADLVAAGLAVRVIEGADAVGGRMRTDRHDGFLLDGGFQVFNTGYPQVRARLRLKDLGLRPFTRGVIAVTDRGHVRIGAPFPRPGYAAGLIPGRLATARDLLALARLSVRDAAGPSRTLKRAPDRTMRKALTDAGFSPGMTERFFLPFFSGVFLENQLATSARVFHLVWRSMLRGTLCLPARGVQAVPEQLAAALPPGTVALGTPVRELTEKGLLLADGAELPAPRTVVATGPAEAARLLPGLEVPHTRTVTTYYHVTGTAPLDDPVLLIDSARRQLLNTCVISRVAPGYAPPGRALISTSVLGPDTPGRRQEVLDRLAMMYRTDTTTWEPVAARTVPGALPAMPPPQPLSRTTRLGGGRYVCGDHRATGSVQGALASGARAAREVLADLRAPSGSR